MNEGMKECCMNLHDRNMILWKRLDGVSKRLFDFSPHLHLHPHHSFSTAHCRWDTSAGFQSEYIYIHSKP